MVKVGETTLPHSLYKARDGSSSTEDEARNNKLREALETKEKLLSDDLRDLGIVKADECSGCTDLRQTLEKRLSDAHETYVESNRYLQNSNQELATTVNNLNTEVGNLNKEIRDMQKVMASMVEGMESMQSRNVQLLRRMVVQDARKEVVEKLGGTLKSIESYHNYFFVHESEALALGISDHLLTLLKDGTWELNKAAHVASQADKAHAVMGLDKGLRHAFEEAFEFAYHESVNTYWTAAE